MEIKLGLTTGHLWFEEIISGDRHEKMEDVWKHLDQADWYAEAMLNGGSNSKATYFPLDDRQLRSDILTIRNKMVEFKDITQERWDRKEASAVGSDIDQKYDSMFRELIQLTDEAESKVNDVIVADTRLLKWLQAFLVAGSLLLAIYMANTIRRFTRQRNGVEAALRDSEEKFRGLYESSGDAVMLLSEEGFFD